MSLRGNCATPADAALLTQAVGQLVTTHTSQIWVDCQALDSLSETGQQALLHANQAARAVGTKLCWCGLPEHLLAQLSESAPCPTITLLPAEDYRGPAFLRAETTWYAGT